jgi:hypothetical protein
MVEQSRLGFLASEGPSSLNQSRTQFPPTGEERRDKVPTHMGAATSHCLRSPADVPIAIAPPRSRGSGFSRTLLPAVPRSAQRPPTRAVSASSSATGAFDRSKP